jgi:hypothetical protein
MTVLRACLPSGLIQLVQPVPGQIKLFWTTKTEEHTRRVMLFTTANKDSVSKAMQEKKEPQQTDGRTLLGRDHRFDALVEEDVAGLLVHWLLQSKADTFII